MERYERFFHRMRGGPVVFLAALGYGSVGIGDSSALAQPDDPLRGGPEAAQGAAPYAEFDHIGVQQLAPNKFEAVIIGQTWAFTPDEIDVPAGAEVEFVATSSDVIHGFFIPGTRVNMMLIPGQVSEYDYTFTKPGEYLLICHEYCGRLHHTMSGKVVVK